MRFVKIPAILIYQQCQIHAVSYFANDSGKTETISIVKPQLIFARMLAGSSQFGVCVT